MSGNWRLYAPKMAELRRAREQGSTGLRGQLAEILATVKRCEAMWALEDRIEKGGPR